MSNPAENIDEDYRKNKEKIRETIKRLRKKTPKNLDDIFAEKHESVFEEINCLDCANCCKTTSPMLFEKDIERLSSHLRIKPGDFIGKYLFLDTDGIYAFKSSPCPFLGPDNFCSVYEYRPKACREYPHTNQRKMHTLLNLAETNAAICPAVLKILSNWEK